MAKPQRPTGPGRLRIGVDMDMVLAETDHHWYARYTKAYGHPLTRDMVTDWEVHTLVHPDCGSAYYGLRTPDMYDQVRPVPRALGGVASLIAAGHSLVCITSENRPEYWDPYKRTWLRRWFPEITDLRVIGHHCKHEIEIDLLIDDALHNILPAPRPTILLNYPWNLGRETPLTVRRANDWSAVVLLVGMLASGLWAPEGWQPVGVTAAAPAGTARPQVPPSYPPQSGRDHQPVVS